MSVYLIIFSQQFYVSQNLLKDSKRYWTALINLLLGIAYVLGAYLTYYLFKWHGDKRAITYLGILNCLNLLTPVFLLSSFKSDTFRFVANFINLSLD